MVAVTEAVGNGPQSLEQMRMIDGPG